VQGKFAVVRGGQYHGAQTEQPKPATPPPPVGNFRLAFQFQARLTVLDSTASCLPPHTDPLQYQLVHHLLS